MEKASLKCISTKIFIHLSGATYKIVENFSTLVNAKIVDINKIKLITIKYDTLLNNVEDGPVRIYCTDGVNIALDLTAGYGGSGPHDLCKVLEMCKVEFDENDILSSRETVYMRLTKEADSFFYQFRNPDGTYEYSM